MPSTKKLLTAAAGSAGGDKLFVEDVFSTYLYTGNTSNPITINNGIDFSGEGGLFWAKVRSGSSAQGHALLDTVRGTSQALASETSNASVALGSSKAVTYNNNGITIPGNTTMPTAVLNYSGFDLASWSFRKAKGFFDIVTYTGNGTSGRTVAHNLGSVPKIIIIKNLDNPNRWYFWITGFANNDYLYLNETFAKNNFGAFAYLTADPTSTTVTIASDTTVNGNNYNFVMYLFGDDAIFGEDADEQICKMGSYTGNGTTPGVVVATGFEPQFVLVKPATTTGPWSLIDNMRGWTADSAGDRWIEANTTGAEYTSVMMDLTATGFTTRGNFSSTNSNGQTYIYMAIRRPMKVPEAGTEVFQPLTYSGTGTFPNGTDPNSGVATRTISSSLGFDVDMSITKWRSGGSGTPSPSSSLMGRLRGIYNELFTYDTAAETQGSNTGPRFSTRTSRAFDLHDYGVEQLNKSGQALVSYVFKRAPKFMDVVAFSGTGANPLSVSHNLTVAPELMITKRRNASVSWMVGVPSVSLGGFLNTTDALSSTRWSTDWSGFSPTSTIFKVSDGTAGSGDNMIAYLFATLAGISKVGTYTGTGTGTTVNVDCGFSNGARFILIKRTDSSGDWFVYDSSRGINAGDSPYLLFNTAAQEVNTDYIDPLNAGFTVTTDAAATGTLNVNNANYIFLAIA